MGQISAWLWRCVDGSRLLNPSVPCVCLCAADSTGTHSLYTRYQDYEIMFHVSTMLPYTANNTQQVQSTSSSALVLQKLFAGWFILLFSATSFYQCVTLVSCKAPCAAWTVWVHTAVLWGKASWRNLSASAASMTSKILPPSARSHHGSDSPSQARQASLFTRGQIPVWSLRFKPVADRETGHDALIRCRRDNSAKKKDDHE